MALQAHYTVVLQAHYAVVLQALKGHDILAQGVALWNYKKNTPFKPCKGAIIEYDA